MRRPLCTILASFVLISNPLEAQDSKSQSSKPGVLSTSDADATAVDLLQQSHNLSQQLPVSMRLMNLLPRQAEMVSRLRPDLGQEWANELFTLSAQAKGAQRSIAQNAAMRILIRLNPDRALESLQSLNIEEPVPKWATSLPEMQLVQEAFDALAKRDGASALPLLQQEAERLGVQGHYPYAALGFATMSTTSKDWGHDNERAIGVLQSVFEPAFARYSQNAHNYGDDVEFGKMLQVLAGGLPIDSVKPALRLLVKNLLATETSKYQFEAEVYTSDGQTAKVHNAVDATILFFGTLINRDPELAEQLKSTRPELQTALEYAKFGRQRSLNFGPGWQPRNMQSVDSGAEARMDAVRLSHINAEAAIKKAEQLPDDEKRTSTLLEVARGIAGDYPERAAELIAESQSGNKPTDDQLQLNLISAQAFVAAAESKKDDLDELLQRGLESANRTLLEQQRTGAIQIVAGLGPLVQIGIQNDPNLTVTFIESLSPSYLKAELLLGAASALSMRSPLPLSSRPQQKQTE
jgi:hypothetical protein